jgi:hypothetical protein
MRDARKILMVAGASLAVSLTACGREEQPDENQVITDINAADPGDIEALPPDESVDPLPAEDGAVNETGEAVNAADGNLG